MPKIKTKNGVFFYKTIPLYLGRKQIGKAQSKENLFLFGDLAAKHGLQFGLAYGTLLGALREKDFIAHDEDTDLFIQSKDKEILLGMLEELKKNGFYVARWDPRGLLSIVRKDEYIDIYIFSPHHPGVYSCGAGWIPEKFFLHFETLDFLGRDFCVFCNPRELMRFLYGEKWEVPLAYTDFNVSKIARFRAWIKENIKGYLPMFFRRLFYQELERKAEALYMKRIKNFKG